MTSTPRSSHDDVRPGQLWLYHEDGGDSTWDYMVIVLREEEEHEHRHAGADRRYETMVVWHGSERRQQSGDTVVGGLRSNYWPDPCWTLVSDTDGT